MHESRGSPQPLEPHERNLLAELLEAVGPRVVAYVRRMYGRRIDADEIVAETFCRAAANMAALRRCERPELYLLTTARNLCRDSFRRPGVETVGDDRLDRVPNRGESPESRVHDDERMQALSAEIAKLPPVQREVLVLRMASNLKFEEIATLLDIPLGTALSRMHAAVQTLREKLGESHEPVQSQPQRL